VAELLSTLTIALLLVALAFCVAALIRVINGGVAETDAMLRGGVGIGALARGDIPRQPSGASLIVREGMRARVEADGTVEVIETRTIARDAL